VFIKIFVAAGFSLRGCNGSYFSQAKASGYGKMLFIKASGYGKMLFIKVSRYEKNVVYQSDD
jgi:hypothetical protein